LSLRPARIAVPGLRNADPTSLLVMIQDLQNRSIAHLEGGTLADLFSLAELGDSLPRHLQRDLERIARSKEREINDLPDGFLLHEQVELLMAVTPEFVCTRLRVAVLNLRVGRQLEPASLDLLEKAEQAWAEVEPVAPQPGKADTSPVERPAVPKRFQMPDDETPKRRKKTTATATATADRPKARATPAAKVDSARATWIQQHVVERLEARREGGLKESVLLAAACHNSPYGDMQRAEVLAELRELKRGGAVRFSAGRWYRVQRLGW